MSAWTDLGLLVVGGLLTQGGAVTAQLLNRSKDREARREDREATLGSQRRDFQSVTLLELQEALHREMRAIAKAHLEDRRAYQNEPTSGWHGTILPDEINEELHAAGVQILLLRERVLDDKIRELCEQLSEARAFVVVADSQIQSDRALDTAMDVYKELMERLGTVLRDLL